MRGADPLPPQEAFDFTDALRHESRALLSFLWMLCSRRDLADELFQETCLEAWRVHERFLRGRREGRGDDFGAWLRGIARNLFLRHCRSSCRQRTQYLDPTLLEPLSESFNRVVAEQQSLSDSRSDALQSCLQLLNREDRDALTQRYQRGVSLQELSRRQSRAVTAVKAYLYRLRRRLEQCIRGKVRPV